ncbi:class I SAM-dependent methyltransferase [Dictyobacter arantiisoli]|uniref:SAM-dependent methyltransferase n=1 Tax=Dictyobacter arantiisoli TaxID=2014874 RepID=A0A5A5TEK6_9CHLR|nr:SAM-dependent methyltransferase [Dictyobacter arantiisoli]GCF09344.1 SAM-dependent methyltransferase [Dictyobacter arantiisoli]
MQLSSLQHALLERIQQQGAITFEEYMRMALYEPGAGYYVTGQAKMGWEGDYYTSTDIADFFAHCMGRQLQQMWESLGKPAHFGVLEQGAGRGDLAKEVQQWASTAAPEFHAALDYRLADITFGQDALSIRTDDFIPSVILSNELVDAFPVHIVEKQDEALHEVYVTIQNGRLAETLQPLEDGPLLAYFERFHIPWQTFPSGWRAEVNLDAITWMERTSQLLLGPNPKRKRRGFIIAIDYGDSARELYSTERYRGTLASYYQHQFSERPLARPGEQDITAHVNFTALLDAGRQQGLRLHKYTTQRKWLMETGIYEELEQVHQQHFGIIDQNRASDQGQVALLQWYNLRQRVSALTDPRGMGDFKVLILKR